MPKSNNEDIINAYHALGKLGYAAYKGADTEEEQELSLHRNKIIFNALPRESQPALSTAYIINAHNALNKIDHSAQKEAKNPDEEQRITTWQETIRAALPPKPTPTMADIKWDDDKHFFAEAEHPTYGTVIMIDETRNGHIRFTTSPLSIIVGSDCVPKDQLTLTGYRYVRTKEEEA